MAINLIHPYHKTPLILHPDGLADAEGIVFPYVNGAYRIVLDQSYTESFGFQWNKFEKTQLDNTSKTIQSQKRFFAATDWLATDMNKKHVLEVGCGAGRFSEVILSKTNAFLYAVDFSNAVEANYRNHRHYHDRIRLFQASVYDLPFAQGQFDRVFCFGVLQHTPDPYQSIKSLAAMVKTGGEFVVDFYPYKGWWTKLQAKYLLRPWTKTMSYQKLVTLIDKNLDWMIQCSKFFNQLGIGKIVNRFLPMCNINLFPDNLTPTQIREWAILDTFDMFSPAHDHPQKIESVKKWMEDLGLTITYAGEIEYEPGNKVAVVRGKRI